MDLHFRNFDGTTFGMSVDASSTAFKRMKKNIFLKDIKPSNRSFLTRRARCVKDTDIAAVMGEVSWLIMEAKSFETVWWESPQAEVYIIYDDGREKQ